MSEGFDNVAAYAENEDRPFQHWSIHRSLVGSLVLNGERYALNEGHWYRINKAFKDAADRKFTDLTAPPDKKLRPLKKIVLDGAKGKKQKNHLSVRGIVQRRNGSTDRLSALGSQANSNR